MSSIYALTHLIRRREWCLLRMQPMKLLIIVARILRIRYSEYELYVYTYFKQARQNRITIIHARLSYMHYNILPVVCISPFTLTIRKAVWHTNGIKGFPRLEPNARGLYMYMFLPCVYIVCVCVRFMGSWECGKHILQWVHYRGRWGELIYEDLLFSNDEFISIRCIKTSITIQLDNMSLH